MREFEYTIKDELGIHARPAGLLVKAAKATNCRISVVKGDKTADATRLFAVMGLGIKQGDTVTVTCDGENEEEAILQMRSFFENNL
ncbi:MAG: HPr family phosphocarrier protein [Eubacteriales bacterium]